MDLKTNYRYQVKDPRPLSHEITNVWITGDGKQFLDETDARRHQHRYERALALDKEIYEP